MAWSRCPAAAARSALSQRFLCASESPPPPGTYPGRSVAQAESKRMVTLAKREVMAPIRTRGADANIRNRGNAPPSDADARGLLRELDVAGSPGLTEWTVLMLDLARMLAMCGLSGRRADDVQLAADGKTLIITSGDSTIRTSWPEDIHAVFFGPRANWPPGMRYLPPSVRAALADVLPIPLCSYGINYI